MARLVDQTGVDMIFVGDLTANVISGHPNTLNLYPGSDDLPRRLQNGAYRVLW